VPELAINPLSSRVVQLVGICNFKDFCAFLSAFSARSSREEQLRFLFTLHVVDGDGLLSRADLLTTARARAGPALSDEQLAGLVDAALPGGAPLSVAAFCAEMGGGEGGLLHVKVPVDG
jgi:serine/threonine-protein phosphatase 2B regulatory subunit